MPDCIIDSSVAVKWCVSEPDSAKANQVVFDVKGRGDLLWLLDIAFLETANAIWVNHRRGILTSPEAEASLAVMDTVPASVIEAKPLYRMALRLAIKYRIAAYDAALVAAVQRQGCDGVTADGPLVKAVAAEFPNIRLLKDW